MDYSPSLYLDFVRRGSLSVRRPWFLYLRAPALRAPSVALFLGACVEEQILLL